MRVGHQQTIGAISAELATGRSIVEQLCRHANIHTCQADDCKRRNDELMACGRQDEARNGKLVSAKRLTLEDQLREEAATHQDVAIVNEDAIRMRDNEIANLKRLRAQLQEGSKR